MKVLNSFGFVLFLFFILQCSSAQKFQKEAPMPINKIEIQHWMAGIQGGGSGINMEIQVPEKTTIKLDSVFYKGLRAKVIPARTDYIAKFISAENQKRKIVMSNKPNSEYGNELPVIIQKSPFDLKDNECVLSYKEAGKTKYFKYSNVIEKPRQDFPSAPPRNQNED